MDRPEVEQKRPDRLRGVAEAQVRAAAARQQLDRSVLDAREMGATWAEIGEVMGMSRQAAFKRFGAAIDPRTKRASKKRTCEALPERTEQLFRLLDDGRYDLIAEMMTPKTAAALPEALMLDTWAQAVGEYGNLEGFSETRLEYGFGTPLAPDEPVGGRVIGVTRIECEAGAWVGRVAFDGDDRVIGVLIAPLDHGKLPF